MEYVFLFSGQGSQFKGMAEDICKKYPAARAVIDTMSATAGEDIASFLWNTEPAELARSDRSQLAITAMQAAILAVLQEHGITPSAAAGFSLGEFSALYAAKVLDLTTMTKVVALRGKIMQKACEKLDARGKASGGASGMAAVLKLAPERIIEVLKPYSDPEAGTVFAANLNSPMQTVVSGTAAGLDSAEKLCKEAGAKRVVRLAVAGPFHSPLMREAAEEFSAVLQDIPFNDPAVPIFSNVTGKRLLTGAEAKQNAVLHLTHPVRWLEEEQEIAALTSTAALLEVGPGMTLCNLWRDSGCAGNCRPTGTAEQLADVIDEYH
ncbi:MAG: ACP S-malonyltransferase [Treponema sp.]|uniref:ACP S-malonyltransferase n=1 Tax=Treponema sp. TaxID=166 RepID=UPI003FA1DB8C